MNLRKLRRAARSDVTAIFEYYLANGGADIALKFSLAVETTVARILTRPSIGSPYPGLIGLPGLRKFPIKGFPHLAFYLQTPTGPEVVRVAHMSRDIPSTLQE